MEIWGYCRPCTRWFYCPQWFDKMAPEPTCPVCSTAPLAIENRRGARQGSVVGADSAAGSRS